MNLGLRMAYSTDFSTAGRLKRSDGSLRAIMRHNHRTPRPESTEPEVVEVPRLEDAEGGTPKRSTVWRGQGVHRWKENIDPVRIQSDQIWLNPLYGGDGAWTAPADLPEAVQTVPEAHVMAALKGTLGIDVAKDGVLRYGEGFGGGGGRRRSETASAKSKKRRKARKAVREDAVMAVDIILQASPAFFYPKIRAEQWEQKRIDTSFVWERGPLDEDAVTAFRDAGLAWAKSWWGEDLIAEVALHLDESCPHMHIMVIPKADNQLRGGSVVPGPAEAKRMLDKAAPFFRDLYAGMSLERPEEGGQSTGTTYSKRNRAAREEAEVAERRRDEAQKDAETVEAEVAERKAKAEALARDAEIASARRVQVAGQTAEKAEAVATERKAKAEASARVAESESAEKAEVVMKLESRKNGLMAEIQHAEERKAKAEAELADRQIRLDKQEARLQAWTDACQRTAQEMDAMQDELDQRQADQQAVQDAGDEAVDRLREVLRQHPGCRANVAVRHVAESYKAEAVRERRRADEAEQSLAEAHVAMGPFAELLRLPGRVARALWRVLADLLDEHVPSWVQDMRRQEQELLEAERRRQEAEVIKAATTFASRLDGDSPMPWK